MPKYSLTTLTTAIITVVLVLGIVGITALSIAHSGNANLVPSWLIALVSGAVGGHIGVTAPAAMAADAQTIGK